MINATNDPNCSWPGDVHALILSKLIQTNIVMVDNLLKGLKVSFDTSRYVEMFNLVILSAAAQSGRKIATCSNTIQIIQISIVIGMNIRIILCT